MRTRGLRYVQGEGVVEAMRKGNNKGIHVQEYKMYLEAIRGPRLLE